jgi:hypothetical protein
MIYSGHRAVLLGPAKAPSLQPNGGMVNPCDPRYGFND